jgi:ABC-type multidrug transport system fused ATPase/permease subunit
VNVSQQTPLVVRRGQILTVVGRVGSGKSSLIAAMLGELDLEGSSPPIPVNDVNGSAALVSQQAFIMNANVILNITFGLEYDEARFREAIRVSELQADLEQLPDGELTEIGERGINLSGGQKMRVSIARAVYANADVVFMDDPLSSVDAHVGRAIFENCIIEHFGSKGTSLVFVTNALSYLSHPKIGAIVVLGGGGGGEIAERGTYTELCGLKGEFWDLSGGAGAGKYVAGVGGGGKKGEGGGIEVVAEVEKKEEGARGKLITKEEHAKGDVPLATYIQ